MPRDVPCQRLETSPADVTRTSPYGLICNSKGRLNVSNLSAATKNLKTNYTFFVKPKCVLLNRETKTQIQIFEAEFDHIR